MALTLPPDSIIDAIHGSVTHVTRRVDIYESDRTTLFASNVGIIDGSVSIDHARPERRTADLVLDNSDGSLKGDPQGGGFWYDKIIKVHRGVITTNGTWQAQLGEFRIDNFSQRHSSSEFRVTCRDHAKTLVSSEFVTATLFPVHRPIELVVRDIAVSAGIPVGQMDLPLTGESLGNDYVFEGGSNRWEAIKEVSEAYGYEVFFTNEGILTMREFQDPFTLIPSYTFRTGEEGNLIKFDKQATDSFLRNHIVVTGESASSDHPPVWGEVENNNPNSPTSVQRVGRRTHHLRSSMIETQAQAQQVALRRLKVSGLEQFEIDLGSIVVPYMDVGVVVEFLDPDPAPNDPVRYLMQSVTIPLRLGPMETKAGRVINLGA